MRITAGTAATLSKKLAELDLTDEEGVLLTSLIAGEDEVNGFYAYDKVIWTYAPQVLGPLPDRWKAKEGESYANIETNF